MLTKLFIYRNLTKKCWSLKNVSGLTKTHRVIGHADDYLLENCTFQVNENGRQRVIRENKKYVHAGIVGEPQTATFQIIPPLSSMRQAKYNPKRFTYFYDAETIQPLNKADLVYFLNDGRVFYWNN